MFKTTLKRHPASKHRSNKPKTTRYLTNKFYRNVTSLCLILQVWCISGLANHGIWLQSIATCLGLTRLDPGIPTTCGVLVMYL
eukprot:4804788-Amphidinium_carterae.1